MSTDTSILLLLADLVARQATEVGHPDARAQAAMAWEALDQLAGRK